MNAPEGFKYSADHEWIKVEDTTGIIGISDYAQGELGDVVFVDIDPALTEIVKGQSFGTIEAVKTVSDLYAPVSGKVLEINPKLNDEPQLVNQDPYGQGWIIKVEVLNPAELNELMDSTSYKSQF